MPYVIGRPSKFLALAGSMAAFMVAAPSAMAWGGHPVPQAPAQPSSPFVGCPSVSATQLLSQLSDSAFYAPLTGGTFEGPSTNWTLNNASVVNGNESDFVVNSTDSQSLQVNPGGSATSPGFCVDNSFPSWRFFALSSGQGPLNVSAQWADSSGDSGTVRVATLQPDGYVHWAPSPVLPLGSQVPAGMTVTVQLVFSVPGWGSAWNIDDVLLDPYAK